MADVSSNLYDWSTTAASNGPSGTTTIGTGLDDNLREIQAVVRQALAAIGSNIASATTTDIGAVAGYRHYITGNATITSLGTLSPGIVKILLFEGGSTLTHNATSLALPTGANILTEALDSGFFMSEGSGNWRCLFYQRADGEALATTLPTLLALGAAARGANTDITSLSAPALGAATATTQASTTNNTTVATTAFVQSVSLGRNQTWQNVTGSRTAGTTYTNSTSAPIEVCVSSSAGASIDFTLTIGGIAVQRSGYNGASGVCVVSGIVPPATNYVLTASSGSVATWAELRA